MFVCVCVRERERGRERERVCVCMFTRALGKAHMRSITSLRSFPRVAIETVPTFV